MSATLGPAQHGVDFPADPTAAFAVDVSSTDADLSAQFVAGYARWLYVGTGGTLKAQMTGDAAGVTYTVIAGQVLRGHFVKVFHTGTTAGGLVAAN